MVKIRKKPHVKLGRTAKAPRQKWFGRGGKIALWTAGLSAAAAVAPSIDITRAEFDHVNSGIDGSNGSHIVLSREETARLTNADFSFELAGVRISGEWGGLSRAEAQTIGSTIIGNPSFPAPGGVIDPGSLPIPNPVDGASIENGVGGVNNQCTSGCDPIGNGGDPVNPIPAILAGGTLILANGVDYERVNNTEIVARIDDNETLSVGDINSGLVLGEQIDLVGIDPRAGDRICTVSNSDGAMFQIDLGHSNAGRLTNAAIGGALVAATEIPTWATPLNIGFAAYAGYNASDSINKIVFLAVGDRFAQYTFYERPEDVPGYVEGQRLVLPVGSALMIETPRGPAIVAHNPHSRRLVSQVQIYGADGAMESIREMGGVVVRDRQGDVVDCGRWLGNVRTAALATPLDGEINSLDGARSAYSLSYGSPGDVRFLPFLFGGIKVGESYDYMAERVSIRLPGNATATLEDCNLCDVSRGIDVTMTHDSRTVRLRVELEYRDGEVYQMGYRLLDGSNQPTGSLFNTRDVVREGILTTAQIDAIDDAVQDRIEEMEAVQDTLAAIQAATFSVTGQVVRVNAPDGSFTWEARNDGTRADGVAALLQSVTADDGTVYMVDYSYMDDGRHVPNSERVPTIRLYENNVASPTVYTLQADGSYQTADGEPLPDCIIDAIADKQQGELAPPVITPAIDIDPPVTIDVSNIVVELVDDCVSDIDGYNAANSRVIRVTDGTTTTYYIAKFGTGVDGQIDSNVTLLAGSLNAEGHFVADVDAQPISAYRALGVDFDGSEPGAQDRAEGAEIFKQAREVINADLVVCDAGCEPADPVDAGVDRDLLADIDGDGDELFAFLNGELVDDGTPGATRPFSIPYLDDVSEVEAGSPTGGGNPVLDAADAVGDRLADRSGDGNLLLPLLFAGLVGAGSTAVRAHNRRHAKNKAIDIATAAGSYGGFGGAGLVGGLMFIGANGLTGGAATLAVAGFTLAGLAGTALVNRAIMRGKPADADAGDTVPTEVPADAVEPVEGKHQLAFMSGGKLLPFSYSDTSTPGGGYSRSYVDAIGDNIDSVTEKVGTDEATNRIKELMAKTKSEDAEEKQTAIRALRVLSMAAWRDGREGMIAGGKQRAVKAVSRVGLEDEVALNDDQVAMFASMLDRANVKGAATVVPAARPSVA